MVKSINPPDMRRHKNPIPSAAIHRGLLVSSVIVGMAADEDKYPPAKTDQIALAFANLRRLLAAANAQLQDVVKLDLYFEDPDDRALANPHWLEMYPDENARPARHAHQAQLPADCCIQIVVTAVVADQ